MGNIVDSMSFVEQIVGWSGYIALVSVFLVLPILVVFDDRKILVPSLAIMYLMLSLLFINVLAPQIVGIKLVVYIIVWLMVFVSTQHSGWGFSKSTLGIKRLVIGAKFRFRIIAFIIVAIVGWQFANNGNIPFPVVSNSVTLVATQCVCQGLLLLSISRRPLKVGFGIFLMLNGFGLLYSVVESALMVVGMLALIDISIALVICYLELLGESYKLRDDLKT